MADHSLNALQSACRAMEEVVMPAIDAAHPLAREQAGLVLKFLQLFGQRIEDLHAKNRFDLNCALQIAQGLHAHLGVSAAIAADLKKALDRAQQLLGDPAAHTAELKSAATELDLVVTALLRTLSELDPEGFAQAQQVVLNHSLNRIQLQRAWFLPQGWEPSPDSIPKLDQLLTRKAQS